jgi:hypothetical protein
VINGDPSHVYLKKVTFTGESWPVGWDIDPEGDEHWILCLKRNERELYIRPVCTKPRCCCDAVPMTRLDEDRWQVSIKPAQGEMFTTFILTGWQPKL